MSANSPNDLLSWHPVPASVAAEAFTVSSPEGDRLWATRFRPEHGPIRGRFVLLHGIQSHAAWYGTTGIALAKAGWEAILPDRRGSGRNGEPRGHVDRVEQLLEDLEILLETATDASRLPLVIGGVSWGGKLATVAAGHWSERFHGLVLMYPAFRTRIDPTWRERLALRMAIAAGLTRQRIELPLKDPSLLTCDLQWQQRILDDPLTLTRVTTQFLNVTRHLDNLLESSLRRLDRPILLQLAGADALVDNGATQQLLECSMTGRSDKTRIAPLTIHHYANACHTIQLEAENERLTKDLVDWLEEHVGNNSIIQDLGNGA